MNFFDIDILERDPNQNDLYDLSQVTYQEITGFPVFYYIVESYEEMRMDLISNRLYQSTEYVDFLLRFNNIDNPLNIKEGDTIAYIDEPNIEEYRVRPEKSKVTQKALLNANKQTRKDSNRQSYVEEGYSLPPTLLETPVESVQVTNDSILIGISENTAI